MAKTGIGLAETGFAAKKTVGLLTKQPDRVDHCFRLKPYPSPDKISYQPAGFDQTGPMTGSLIVTLSR